LLRLSLIFEVHFNDLQFVTELEEKCVLKTCRSLSSEQIVTIFKIRNYCILHKSDILIIK